MSSSTDPATEPPSRHLTGAVLRGAGAAQLAPARVPDLAPGTWTRLGERGVRGDAATESVLDALAASARDAARAQGYAAGWAEGRRHAAQEARRTAEAERERAAQAEHDRAAEHAAALAALGAAAARVGAAAAEVAARVEDAALDLARELTRALVDHELRADQEPGLGAVRRALTLLPDLAGPGAAGAVPVTVRLHPDVAGGAAAQDLVTRGLRVVPDPSLEPADTVVETDTASVDARVRAALERVLAVLA